MKTSRQFNAFAIAALYADTTACILLLLALVNKSYLYAIIAALCLCSALYYAVKADKELTRKYRNN